MVPYNIFEWFSFYYPLIIYPDIVVVFPAALLLCCLYNAYLSVLFILTESILNPLVIR